MRTARAIVIAFGLAASVSLAEAGIQTAWLQRYNLQRRAHQGDQRGSGAGYRNIVVAESSKSHGIGPLDYHF
jgi:hypothetical protein